MDPPARGAQRANLTSSAALHPEKEVDTQFERKWKENRTVLFPIRLEDAVMETTKPGFAAHDTPVTSRNGSRIRSTPKRSTGSRKI